MSRAAVVILTFAGLAAWAGAQGQTPGASAADRLRLLRANRAVIGDLVAAGVKFGRQDDPINRAAACAEVAGALTHALGRAAADPAADPDRVAELGRHLTAVVGDGLVPVLDDARRAVPEGSPRAPELARVREKAGRDLADCRRTIPAAGAVAADPAVKDVCDQLDRLREKLK